MKAAASGYLSCFQLLLTHGADTDLQNEAGVKATRNNFPDIVGELLSHGADDQIQDEDGQNALAHAEDRGNQDVIRMFEKERNEKLVAAAGGHCALPTVFQKKILKHMLSCR